MPLMGTLADDFSIQDTAKWTFAATGDITVTGGQLQIVPTGNYSEVRSIASYDLTASYARIEVVQPPNQGNGSVTSALGLTPDASGNASFFEFVFTNGGLSADYRVSGGTVTNVNFTTYDATNHRWLRISESGGSVFWHTSPDGRVWTQFGTVTTAASFASTAVYAYLNAGYWGTEPTPGTSIIDNFNLLPGVWPGYVNDRGTTANATAATTSSVTLTSPTTIAVGNYLIARVAVDNSGTNGAAPGCTVTDPRSNTWTVLGPALVDPGAAAAGATAYLCYTKVTTAYQAADALTFNWGGVSTTAKAIVVEEWTNIHPTAPVAVSAVTANAAASTAVTVSITPTASNQLVYTCLATEGIAGDSITYDSDTTNGTWTTLSRTASANATATNNQCVAGQYKVVTAAGAQSWDATITNRDWAALAVVFAPPPLPPAVTVINQAALVRASSW